jgi:lysophospholipase L1-like esterase
MADTNHITYFVTGATSYTNYDWEALPFDNKIFVIEPYMENPYMVFIGDSIISGYGNGLTPDEHSSFIEGGTDLTNIPVSIENQWSRKVNDRTYQNMGYAGQGIRKINNRFNSDVVNLSPEFSLMEGGINDLNSNSLSVSEIIANWESMIQKAQNNDITPVILLILPPNINGDDGLVNKVASVNEQLMNLATKYSPSIVVDARCYVGVYRSSGPAGNCWNTNPSYTIDIGLHFNRFGTERIAQAIKDSFRFVYGKQGLYNLIQSDGTIIYSTNLKNSINTSWRMASTTGSANVSYNVPSSGELADFTIYSGTINWFSMSNISSNPVCSLYSNGVKIESKQAVNHSVNFTNDILPGTYHAQCAKDPGVYSIGDVNNDGTITSADALLYLRYAVGQNISPFNIDPVRDDVTCDDRITSADALKILRKAVGQNVDLICHS